MKKQYIYPQVLVDICSPYSVMISATGGNGDKEATDDTEFFGGSAPSRKIYM